METKKVTMGFGERDLANVDFLLDRLNSRSKAAAVGQSLDIARLIVDTQQKGGKVIITDADGNQKELVIPGLSI